MRKLIYGNLDFQKNVRPQVLETFQKLAQGQNPDTLFITCSDSRVMPDFLASTDPGDLFMFRNVGNLVPPFQMIKSEPSSVGAALEYAVRVLKVKDIIVCGHSTCGAMQAILNNNSTTTGDLELVNRWLDIAKPSYERFLNNPNLVIPESLPKEDQLSQVNVLQQMSHILSYPLIQEAISNKLVSIHGWWFNIKDVSIHVFDPEVSRFVMLDPKQAHRILKEEEAFKCDVHNHISDRK